MNWFTRWLDWFCCCSYLDKPDKKQYLDVDKTKKPAKKLHAIL